jgi:hypothetical protein
LKNINSIAEQKCVVCVQAMKYDDCSSHLLLVHVQTKGSSNFCSINMQRMKPSSTQMSPELSEHVKNNGVNVSSKIKHVQLFSSCRVICFVIVILIGDNI